MVCPYRYHRCIYHRCICNIYSEYMDTYMCILSPSSRSLRPQREQAALVPPGGIGTDTGCARGRRAQRSVQYVKNTHY